MSVIVSCPQTLRYGLSGTAKLWLESDLTAPAASDLAFSQPADTGNQKRDAYLFTASVGDGLYFVQLIETGAINPFWSGYVYVLNSVAIVIACDFRETAIAMTNGASVKVTVDTNLDAKVSEAAKQSSIVTPPTAAQIRQEMDTNSTKLVHLDADVSSRSQPSDIDSLRGSGISFVSPLSADGKRLKIVTGDSYTVANGQSFRFRLNNRPELIGFTPCMRLQGESDDLAVAPDIVSGTQDIVMNDVLSDRTEKIKVGDGTRVYQLRFIKDGDKATPVNGTAEIIEGH